MKSGDCDLVIRTLVEHADEIDAFSQGHTPLILSCAAASHELPPTSCRPRAAALEMAFCSTSIAKTLIDARANVNLQGQVDGTTPLMASAFLGDSEMIKLLLQANADPNLVTFDGRTALFGSCTHGHKECVSLLLEAGAHHERAEREGATPLIMACSRGYATCAEQLLAVGADPEAGMLAGLTPMGMACSQGHVACVQMLSSFGARRHRIFADGQCPGSNNAEALINAEAVCMAKHHAKLARWLRASRDWSALHHIEVLSGERARALLRGGADLHAQPLWRGVGGKGTEAGPDTPLKRAQKFGHSTDASRLLLSAASPWGPKNHDLFPFRTRKLAYRLLLVGYQLASMLPAEEGRRGLVDVWIDAVLPLVLTRGVDVEVPLE